MRAGIFQIGGDRRIRCRFAAFDQARLDQQPRGVADGGNRLARSAEFFDQRNNVFVGAQNVRVHLTARQDEGVVISDTYVSQRLVGGDSVAPILLIPAFDVLAVRGHDMYGRTFGAQVVQGALKLGLLETVG